MNFDEAKNLLNLVPEIHHQGAEREEIEALAARFSEAVVFPARIDVDERLATEYGHFELTSVVGDAHPTEGRANYISVWQRDEQGIWRKHLDSWW